MSAGKRDAPLLLLLALALAAAAAAGVALGTVRVNPLAAFGPAGAFPGHARDIIVSLRLPRVLAALLAGGALSVSGAVFQGVFRNPLVEPYTLGVSGGAVLGIALATVLGLEHPLAGPVFALAGAFASVFLVLSLSRRHRDFGISVTLLTGLMFSFISGALLMLVMALVRADQMQRIFYWTMGNLGGARLPLLGPYALATAAAVLAAWRLAPALNALALGEESAHYLGIPVARLQKIFFFLASLLAALAVSLGGIIGFVGLLVPHALRPFLGADARSLLPGAFLGGGAFLILCDLVSRTVIAPLELPVGVITGIIGGSLFIVILYRKSLRA